MLHNSSLSLEMKLMLRWPLNLYEVQELIHLMNRKINNIESDKVAVCTTGEMGS